MRKFCRTSEKKGFILVTVLLISALFLSAAAAYAMFARQEMRRVAAEEFAASSRELAVIACREAGGWIAADKSEGDSRHKTIYSGDPIKLNYGDYSVYVTLTPKDDKIPINSLLLPDGVTMKNEYLYPWNAVWGNIGFKTIPPVLDFIDADKTARQGGREDDYFPNRPLGDLSELLLLPEITAESFYAGISADIAVDSYFTVYGNDGININMAPAEVIKILDPEIGQDVADAVSAFRLENAIKGEGDLTKIAGFSSSSATRLKNVIHYRSNFFLAEFKVERGASARVFEAALFRSGSGCEIINWRE